MSDDTEKDKITCFYNYLGWSHVERNIASKLIIAGSNLAIVILAIYKLTNPIILISNGVICSLASWMATTNKTKTYENELQIRDRIIRKLSINSEEMVKRIQTFVEEDTKKPKPNLTIHIPGSQSSVRTGYSTDSNPTPNTPTIARFDSSF